MFKNIAVGAGFWIFRRFGNSAHHLILQYTCFTVSGVAIGCAWRAVHVGQSLVGGPDEPCVGKRGSFWNPYTRALPNLAMPLVSQLFLVVVFWFTGNGLSCRT